MYDQVVRKYIPGEQNMSDEEIEKVSWLCSSSSLISLVLHLVNVSSANQISAFIDCLYLVPFEPPRLPRGCLPRGGFLVQSGRGVDEWPGTCYRWWSCFVDEPGIKELFFRSRRFRVAGEESILYAVSGGDVLCVRRGHWTLFYQVGIR